MEQKKYFRIKDIAEFVGENTSTLRYWESEFRELKPKRGEKGRRLYTPDDIDTIKKIQFLLRTKGMHISAAKEQLRKNNKNISLRASALDELMAVREELLLLYKSLKKINSTK